MTPQENTLQKATIMDGLRTQIDLLTVARMRQLTWMDRAHDPELARLHTKAVELLNQTIKHFDRMLDEYLKDPNDLPHAE